MQSLFPLNEDVQRSQAQEDKPLVIDDIDELRAKLLGSLLLYTQYFFLANKRREFSLKSCAPRESYAITICRFLTRIVRENSGFWILNARPRIGKTELISHFFGWGFCQNPESENMYTGFAKDVVTRTVMNVRAHMKSHEFVQVFPWAELSSHKSLMSKDTQTEFYTKAGGFLYGVGAGGVITSRGFGRYGASQFSGCGVVDDGLNPEDASSRTVRENANEWLVRTFLNRRNDPNSPILLCAQRLDRDDQTGFIEKNVELFNPTRLNIPSIDENGNFLLADKDDQRMLIALKKTQPYVFYSQQQGEPESAEGCKFPREYFAQPFSEPAIFSTFITVDTAETTKKENDATVFSFWGIYRSKELQIPCLHWLACKEIRIEPKDLKDSFIDFYVECCEYKKPPSRAYIEKKSTGVTLISVLKEVPGINVIDITPTKNKMERFKECQHYVYSRQVTFPRNAPHYEMCVSHIEKITFNDTHPFDDIMDTLSDAIHVALIKRILYSEQTELQDEERATLLERINR